MAGWINVEKSNFMPLGRTCQFNEGVFTCDTNAEPSAIKRPASEIIFLNKPPNRGRVSGSTDTNIFKNAFYVGTFLAFLMEIFAFFGGGKTTKISRKQNARIIVKFADDKFFSGKTDLNTFFAVQNAWLDSK